MGIMAGFFPKPSWRPWRSIDDSFLTMSVKISPVWGIWAYKEETILHTKNITTKNYEPGARLAWTVDKSNLNDIHILIVLPDYYNKCYKYFV